MNGNGNVNNNHGRDIVDFGRRVQFRVPRDFDLPIIHIRSPFTKQCDYCKRWPRGNLPGGTGLLENFIEYHDPDRYSGLAIVCKECYNKYRYDCVICGNFMYITLNGTFVNGARAYFDLDDYKICQFHAFVDNDEADKIVDEISNCE